MDPNLAQRILDQAKAEELWLMLIQKAKRADTTHELVAILKYLEDRAYGKPMQAVQHSPDQPMDVSVTHDVTADAAMRLEAILSAAAKRAAAAHESGQKPEATQRI